MLLAFALLPVMLLGAVLGGTRAWLHAHGSQGGHLHLLAEPIAEHHPDALRDCHAAQHRNTHDDGGDARHEDDAHHPDDMPAPAGLLIDLPHVPAAPCAGTTLVSASSALPATLPAPRWTLALVDGTHRQKLYGSGWPPQRAKRSGVATLLRSSHAILI
jgi:hypothetical protein